MKIFLYILISIFIVMQFYRPDINNKQVKSFDDFLLAEDVPYNIATIFQRSCYDCHSNYTNYNWFDNIAPISWYIDKKIKRAKFSLNFSEWGKFEPWQRRLFLQGGISYDISIDRMPPKSYLILHPDARLNNRDKEMILEWISKIDFTKE